MFPKHSQTVLHTPGWPGLDAPLIGVHEYVYVCVCVCVCVCGVCVCVCVCVCVRVGLYAYMPISM